MEYPKKIEDDQIKDLIASSQNKEIDFPMIINSEVNLLFFPFFALSTKGLKKKVETEYRDIVIRDGKRIEILWNVAAHAKYGYPGPFDREVHKAIERIITGFFKKYGHIENPICLGSLYNICNLMNIKEYGGYQYREIRSALERIKTTVIKSEGSFYYKGEKQWISKVFSLYDSVVFKGEQLTNGHIADSNFIYLSDLYIQSLNSFYIKPIDYTYLQSLKSKIASRLYEILGIKFYGIKNKKEGSIRYKYSTLCQLLPVTPFKQLSRSKQQLNPAHNELKDTGFISQFKWSENGKKDWLLYYWPGERAKKEMKDNKVKQFDFNEDKYLNGSDIPEKETGIKKQTESDRDNDLINKLVNLNVSKITAGRIVKKYNNEIIKDWVRAIDFTNAENKAAYIVKAVKEDWQLPEEYLREKENNAATKEQEKINSLQKEQREKKNKKLQEEKQQLDRIYHSLDPEKQKEVDLEAENRLDDFWKSQLNKEKAKGKLSKILQAALDQKRREITKEWNDAGRIKV
jgi:hypothetical protein